jgi:hypothetical protein
MPAHAGSGARRRANDQRMAWWKEILGLGGASAPQPDAVSGAPPPRPDRPRIPPDDPRIAEGRALRRRHWQRLGLPEAEPITYLSDPALLGVPAWPSGRQSYQVVRRSSSLVLATDGLSDPFVATWATEESGFGVEVFVEIPGAESLDTAEIRDSWAFGLIEIVAQNIAGFGGIADRLDRDGIVAMAVPLILPPGPGWVDEIGFTGVLIGLPARRVATRLDLPFGPVRMLAVTLLRPDEALFAARGGANREDLAARLRASGHEHLSDPARPSLL